LEEPDSRGEFHGNKTLKKLPEDLREQINAILKAVRKISPEMIPDKQKRDEICLSAMRRAFELKLAQYTTKADEDAQLLSADTASGRPRMALFVRYGEKLLLQEAIELANQKVDDLTATHGEESQPSAKRVRTK
jgi:N-lysine methyltransferase SETD6